jgi:hypothetical protein
LRTLDVTPDLPFAFGSASRGGGHESGNEGRDQRGLIAFDDLLWLRELRIEQDCAVSASPIPDGVLELFVTRGLVERTVGALRLTPSGVRVVQNLM